MLRRGYPLFIILSVLACAWALTANAQTAPARRTRVAVLDFGETEAGRRVADVLASELASASTATGTVEKAERRIEVLDRELVRVASRGVGYTGSLNMTLEEARNLGAAIGCDFFITGEAQTLRRSPADAPAYEEAYASVFIVSARTGRLVLSRRPSVISATTHVAERGLLSVLGEDTRTRYAATILEAQAGEETERRAQLEQTGEEVVVFEDLSKDEGEGSNKQSDLRPPQPYRRLQPVYTRQAALAEVEATVDVLLDIDAAGEVSRVEVVRWAGYGLDESVSETVRRMHFRPAMRGRAPVPVRVLLRYNFRRPPKSGEQAQPGKP
ncbi:MAG TPA: energy transducer TonB [Pyrinomonadaceae bacterium]|jgi:TonB family protein